MGFKFNPLTGKLDLVDTSGGGVTDHTALTNIGTKTHATLDSEVDANNAKVTNATHTGEITGSTSLVVDKTAISNKSLVVAALIDHILIGDGSDSDNLKKVTVQTIIDLAPDTDTTDHTLLSNIGTNTHAQIDSFITTVNAFIALFDLSGASLNDVLKWNGTQYVNGTAGDTTEFTFSIDSFSDGISDTSQLIGSGTWQAIGAISFTATYSNAPGGMTAEVALSGSDVAWAGNLSMTPVEGPETNTEAVAYPTSTGGTITFTLSQSADGTTDTETVTFNNTMRYGNSTLTEGNQTEASIEALSEVGGPNESRSQTINNISTTANKLVFSYADRLSDVQQVRGNDGNGYITAAFNATRTSVAPAIQTLITNVANSAGYSETFAALTSVDNGLANGTNDFQLLTSSTAQNYLYYGKTTVTSGFTESDVEGLSDLFASNDNTRSDWETITLGAGEYYLIAFPNRLAIPVFKDEDTGFAFSLESPETVTITNWCGFQEDYNVWRSTNPNLGAFNLLTE